MDYAPGTPWRLAEAEEKASNGTHPYLLLATNLLAACYLRAVRQSYVRSYSPRNTSSTLFKALDRNFHSFYLPLFHDCIATEYIVLREPGLAYSNRYPPLLCLSYLKRTGHLNRYGPGDSEKRKTRTYPRKGSLDGPLEYNVGLCSH